ncbi:hypothetical protein N7G274_007541 [Stereocaulon virgatum]|uniref:Uncharacterized protein n=1 Tax=Stereocaulon virgatum TaxID=373712 RepID=A0ABR4A163_9LECA
MSGSHNVTSYEPSIVTQAFQQPITADGSEFEVRTESKGQFGTCLLPVAILWIRKHTARDPPSARYEAADLGCGIASGRCMVGVANWRHSVTPLGPNAMPRMRGLA